MLTADGRHTSIAWLLFSDRYGGTFCLRPGVVVISTAHAGKINFNAENAEKAWQFPVKRINPNVAGKL